MLCLQVKRGDLEDWMKQPHMREALLGGVVRVALGRRADDLVASYSMCLVHDVEDGKQYTCAFCSIVPIALASA